MSVQCYAETGGGKGGANDTSSTCQYEFTNFSISICNVERERERKVKERDENYVGFVLLSLCVGACNKGVLIRTISPVEVAEGINLHCINKPPPLIVCTAHFWAY